MGESQGVAGKNKSVNEGARWFVGSSCVGTLSRVLPCLAKRANDVSGSRRWRYHGPLQFTGLMSVSLTQGVKAAQPKPKKGLKLSVSGCWDSLSSELTLSLGLHLGR